MHASRFKNRKDHSILANVNYPSLYKLSSWWYRANLPVHLHDKVSFSLPPDSVNLERIRLQHQRCPVRNQVFPKLCRHRSHPFAYCLPFYLRRPIHRYPSYYRLLASHPNTSNPMILRRPLVTIRCTDKILYPSKHWTPVDRAELTSMTYVSNHRHGDFLT